MSVIITAIQAAPGDVVLDAHGSLWRREQRPSFELVILAETAWRTDYGIEPDDEPQVSLDDFDAFGPIALLMRDGKPVGDTLPEPKPPRIVEFEYTLHDRLDTMERNAEISRQVGFPIVGELADRMMEHPFYEVNLRCSLNTETGEIKILEAK